MVAAMNSESDFRVLSGKVYHVSCWFSDNHNAVRILQTGSRKPDLQNETLAIFLVTLTCQRAHAKPGPNYS